MDRGKEGAGLAGLREERVIGLFRRAFPAASPRVPLGIGDDAALVEIFRGRRILFTADHMAEGVHFTRRGTPPEDLGYKLAAMNVSDIGAMGGVPGFALLSLALPRDLDPDFLRRFSLGLGKASRRYGFHLVGGDTTASRGGIFASLALVGTLAGRRPLRRSGARPGELLYVTGHLGASAAGLAALEGTVPPLSSPLRAVLRRHLRPAPPLAFGAALGKSGLATAALDVSDGISTDLARLCRESGTGAEILPGRLPIRASTRRAAEALGLDAGECALHGGEEYELLFTARRKSAAGVEALARQLRVRLTCIGTITPSRELVCLTRGGERRPLPLKGWQHF